MVDTVRNWQGAICYISPAAPSDLSDVATYNANAFNTGGNAYKQVTGILNYGGNPGVTRGIAKSAAIDRNTVLKALVDSQDYGQVTLEIEKDDNDSGQAALITAASNRVQQTFKVMFEAKSGGAAHQEGDEAFYFRGFVIMDTNPGGGGSDFIKRNATIELTAKPIDTVSA